MTRPSISTEWITAGVGCGGFAAEFRLAGDERAREAGVGSCVASALVGLEDQTD